VIKRNTSTVHYLVFICQIWLSIYWSYSRGCIFKHHS